MNITFPGGPPQYAARWSPSDPFTSLPAEQAFPALFLTAMETDPHGAAAQEIIALTDELFALTSTKQEEKVRAAAR